MKRGKRYDRVHAEVSRGPYFSLTEVIAGIKKIASAKFDETVEISANLGVDPRHADQQVRGTLVLPHGTGKSVRVLVFAKGEKETEAEEAGADYVGSEYVDKIKGGWLDFEAVVATPDSMGDVGKLGRILGPRGLMPSPKAGTVTFDVGKAVRDLKAGKIEFRVDKGSNVAASIGKASFEHKQLEENAAALLGEIVRNRPSAAKGVYLKAVTLSTTMGPGLQLDPAWTAAEFK